MLVNTSNDILPVPLLTTPNGQGPTLAAGPTLCDLPLQWSQIPSPTVLSERFHINVDNCERPLRGAAMDPTLAGAYYYRFVQVPIALYHPMVAKSVLF